MIGAAMILAAAIMTVVNSHRMAPDKRRLSHMIEALLFTLFFMRVYSTYTVMNIGGSPW